MNATGADAKPGPKVRQPNRKVTVGADGRAKQRDGKRPNRFHSRRSSSGRGHR